MAFRSNAERMETMHSICKREFEQLQINLSKFILDSETIMANDIFKSFRKEPNHHSSHTNVFALLAFDRYMSRVTAATNLARKFSIHLQLHNLKKVLSADVGLDISPVSYLLEEFVEWHNELKANAGCFDYIREWKSLRNEEEDLSVAISLAGASDKVCDTDKIIRVSNPIVRKITYASPESLTLETWPSCVQLLNLSVFVVGYKFYAYITYIDNVTALSFYICQMRNDTLYELSNVINLPKSVRMPPSNVVFGISINNKGILRGVLQTPDCISDDDVQILLIDYGELVPLNCNDMEFYDLSKMYRDIPAQAIKCTLLGIKKSHDDIETDAHILRNILCSYEFKEVNLEVVRKTGRILYVYIIEKREFGIPKNQINKNINASTNPFVNSFDENLYDNVSQSQRLELGSNNNLKFLSRPRINYAMQNDIIELEVVHIARPDYFYGQILKEKKEQLEQLFWNTEEVTKDGKLVEPPKLGDLVLAQYVKDEFWYRAKVIDTSEKDVYKVFYVDYGNTESVAFNNIARCNIGQEKEPFRAVVCRFAGLSDNTNGDEFRFKQAVEMLVVTLLNQRIKVQIVEKVNDEELIVYLLDKEYAEMLQRMIGLGYAKEI